MMYFEEFKQIHIQMKKDIKSASKVKKPVKKSHRELPSLGDLQSACSTISKITGIDSYKLRDLILSGDFSNPLIEQPIKDLFMGLILISDIEPSMASRYADEIRRANKEIDDTYSAEIEKYNHASKVSQAIRTNTYRGPSVWFKGIVKTLVAKIQDNIELSKEEKSIIDAIIDQKNQMVKINGEYQPDILRTINFSTEDVVRIMRRSRDLFYNQ